MHGTRMMFDMKKKTEFIVIALLLAVTLGLRLWQLDSVPPGWRDDELINSLVISQHTIDGDVRAYYADASGHEGLYHILNAGFLALFGPTPAGIRLLSVILGCVTIFFTYLLTKEMFSQHTYNEAAGLIAAFVLSLSFWSLMYSRVGIRHIALPALVLPCFTYFWRWFNRFNKNRSSFGLTRLNFDWPLVLAAVCLGAAYYTYFASRGVPLILVAFVAYLALVDGSFIRRSWKHLLFFATVSTLLAVPLYLSIQAQAGADARVAELAVPLIAMREGDFAPLFEHIRITLGMIHITGDGEFLYNIPGRPLFGPLGAILFWLGILICLWQSVMPLWMRWVKKSADLYTSNLPYLFLLLWWLAGISPAFISVPPASLSHTILAQSAIYMIVIVPLLFLLDQNENSSVIQAKQITIITVYSLLLIIPIVIRDLPDYFVVWPQRGQTRFLYRADIHELADEVANDRLVEFAIGSPLAGPWDKVAFEANLGDAADSVLARWYNPERATFLLPRISIFGRPRTATPWQLDTFGPIGTGIGEFNAYRASLLPFPKDDEICFENELCITPHLSTSVNDFKPGSPIEIEVVIQIFVTGTEQLPIIPLVSNPPPPNVYAGPRLAVFVQLLDKNGIFITGDDGLWVDPETLEVGDLFQQKHLLQSSTFNVGDTIAFGFYDPKTGQRILTADGRDHVELKITSE
ncbi:MAG: hypothetical protein ACI9EW_000595 [Cellvibrionaceae bacterium]|jgi:hypothetical protein